MKAILVLLLAYCTQPSYREVQPLFRIVQNDRVGYINEKDEMVIKPAYLGGNQFSEGLAAVRLNGLYGFIDQTGSFIIPPQYDLATNFNRGMALVYKDGKPYFIDKNGSIVVPEVYKDLFYLHNGRYIVGTHTNKQGVIDIASKKLVIDTVFSSIGNFSSGVAIVREYIPPGIKGKEKRVGVIDSNGKMVIPFGRYKTIRNFSEGYAVVDIADPKDKNENIDGVIDTKGNLLFKRPCENNSYIDNDFHDGYAKVSLYKYWIPEENGVISTSEKYYEGFINLEGELVFNDTNYRYVTDFSNGRAFIKKSSGDNYILIDRDFKRIGNDSFRDIPRDGFHNGYAIVQTDDGTGIIDTTGRFVVPAIYNEIDDAGIVNGYFFFAEQGKDYSKLYGIADLEGNVIVKPILRQFDRNGFVNGLLEVIIDDKLAFINQKGEIVWQQQEETTDQKPLNIDFMNRGYFYAYSTPKHPGEDDSNGWATSPNKPKRITGQAFPDNILAVVIDTARIDTFANRFIGYRLFVSNTTNDTARFNAQDSRLYLTLQAQDSKGLWRDIEYLPSSWCGNSYHTIQLEPNAFWSFTIPKYVGEFPTNIRAELVMIDKENPKEGKLIYSNTIKASINPGQFWNKRTYHPSGLMDPYFD